MVLGYNAAEIIKLALDGQGPITDGCALYDYDEGKMVSGSYTSGTIENPENHLLEVYRISQGDYTDGLECHECPYDDEEFMAKMKKECPELYPGREECCKEVWFDNACECFCDDFYDNDEEMSLRQEIRDIISDHISDDLHKLHDIHIKRYELFASVTAYQNAIFNDHYEINILDALEDEFFENGFKIDDLNNCLSGDIDFEHVYWGVLADYDEHITDAERELAANVADKLLDMDLDGALKLLQ